MHMGGMTGGAAERRRGGGRSLWGVLSAVVAAMGLCGCAAGTAAPDESARAHLDRVSGEIVMPLDEYAFYGRHADDRTFDAAARAVIGDCMRAKGFVPPPARVQADPATDLDDRTFGIWEEQRAARYGWGHAEPPLEASLAEARAAGGPSWSAAYDACNGGDASVTKTMDTILPPQAEYLDGLVSRLESEAMNNAEGDERWQQARRPWEKCLIAAGLAPEEGRGYNSKQSRALLDTGAAENTEEGIRLASIEARCNTETRMTQKLADLEAAYQQPLIDANQAALNKVKERKQELLSAARDYIDAHG